MLYELDPTTPESYVEGANVWFQCGILCSDALKAPSRAHGNTKLEYPRLVCAALIFLVPTILVVPPRLIKLNLIECISFRLRVHCNEHAPTKSIHFLYLCLST
jgi:hypothetical protein